MSGRTGLTLVATALSVLLAGPVVGAEEPTNAQLYQMILKLQGDQKQVRAEADAAKAEAAAANQRLKQTRWQLETARKQLESTRQTLDRTVSDAVAAEVARIEPAAGGAKPKFETGFRLSAEGRYVLGSPNLSHFAGEIGRPGTGTVGPTENISIETQDTDFNGGGVRADLGYTTGGGWDLGAAYTGIFVNGRNQIGDQGNDSDNVFANRFDRSRADNLGLNGQFDDGIVDFASEEIKLDHHILDVDAGRHMALTDDLQAFPFAGVRLANLQFEAETVYLNLEGVADLDQVNIKRQETMRGAGLHFGSKFSYHIGDSGLSLFTTPEVSLLYAHWDVTRDEVQFDTSDRQVAATAIRTDDNSIVPVFDATIGFEYAIGPFNLQAGYQYSNWFGAIRTFEPTSQDDIDGSTVIYEIDESDLNYGGLFLRAGGRF